MLKFNFGTFQTETSRWCTCSFLRYVGITEAKTKFTSALVWRSQEAGCRQDTGLPMSLSCRREISLFNHNLSASSLSMNSCKRAREPVQFNSFRLLNYNQLPKNFTSLSIILHHYRNSQNATVPNSESFA